MSDSEEDRDRSEEEEEEDDDEKSEEEEDEDDDDDDNEDEDDDDDDDEDDEDEDDDDDEDDKKKKKKKGKENDVDDEILKRAEEQKAKEAARIEPPGAIISSVSRDLDSLSDHLSSVFSSFQTHASKGISTMDSYQNYEHPQTTYYHGQQQAQWSPQGKQMSPRPWSENKAIQCDDLPGGQSKYSKEARQAVQDYKMRKMVGTEAAPLAQSNYYTEPILNEGSYRKPTLDDQIMFNPEKEKRSKGQNAGPSPRTRKPDQLIDNYYASLYKRANNESNQNRTIQDLYKNKPKHLYVEDEINPVDRYNDTGKRSAANERMRAAESTLMRNNNRDQRGLASQEEINGAMNLLKRKF